MLGCRGVALIAWVSDGYLVATITQVRRRVGCLRSLQSRWVSLVRAACVSGGVSGFVLGWPVWVVSAGLNWVGKLDGYFGRLAFSLLVFRCFLLVVFGFGFGKNFGRHICEKI